MTCHLDHTLSSPTGHFLYIDTNGRATGDDAQLVSPSFKGSQPRCMHFWYHLYGAGQGILQIQQKPDLGRGKTLWTKTNDQGKRFDQCVVCDHSIIVL
jgi:MAM domain, meprin/A5/mu